MTNSEALKFAEEMKSKISYRLECAATVPARSYYEKQDEMLTRAIAALREQEKRVNPQPLTEDDLRWMMGEPVWCVYEGGASWFIVHESLFTILNGLTAYRYKPGDFGEANKITPMTNGDGIRAMSDEELAQFLHEEYCPSEHRDGVCDEDCKNCWLRYLRKPAEVQGDV